MEGINQNLELSKPVEENIFHMTQEVKDKYKINTLPHSLENAVAVFEQSDFARKTLGDHIFNKLIENKKLEWERYHMHVSKYEINNYMPML